MDTRKVLIWEGINHPIPLGETLAAKRNQLANDAKAYRWDRVIEILRQNPELVNTIRPGGKSAYTPLHQAAHGGAPVEIVEELLRLGAWRTLRNVHGKRPFDIAQEKGYRQLLEILEPVDCKKISFENINRMTVHFHTMILNRYGYAEHFLLRLPPIEPLTEFDSCEMNFSLPEGFGGYTFWLDGKGDDAFLQINCWFRLGEHGLIQGWIVSPHGSLLIYERSVH